MRHNLGERFRLGAEDGSEDLRRASVPERPAPGQRLVEHRAEREDVGACARLLSLELLRGHVLERAEDRPIGRESPRPCPPLVASLDRGCDGTGKPEIEQLGARARHDDVARFQVTVHDAVPVRLIESVGDLNRKPQRLLNGQGPAREQLGERLALQVFHDEKVDSVLAADVIERADVGVIQTGDSPGLPLEPQLPLRVLRPVARQYLEGNAAPQARVGRAINLSHSARPEGLGDLVRTQPRSGNERHSGQLYPR